jgi:pimeloyl-ACP methyl ester carboxylesterase
LSRFFSGFSFQNEERLFSQFIKKSLFNVSGFSYGAILAIEYALSTNERVDTLQLFSPAFFKNKDEKFKKMQLLGFRKDKESYREQFLKNSFYPKEVDLLIEQKDDKIEDLRKLLYFDWSDEVFEKLAEKGLKIEVYLGEFDKIIDSKKAFQFFKERARVCLIKGVGHTLN